MNVLDLKHFLTPSKNEGSCTSDDLEGVGGDGGLDELISTDRSTGNKATALTAMFCSILNDFQTEKSLP